MQSMAHGDFAKVLWNSLDADAWGVQKVHMKENAAATPVALPQVLRRAKCKPCRTAVLSKFVENLRQRRAVPRRPRAFTWAVRDWLALSRALPGLTSCASTEAGEMHVVRTLFTQSDTAVVLSSSHLINAVIGMLRNKGYVKLCGDGTFRLIRGGWVLISIGVLTKRYSPAERRRSFTSAFHPLVYAITNKVSAATYREVFRGACTAVSHFHPGVQLEHVVRQYHADLRRSPSKLRISHISLARHQWGKRHRS